MDGGRHNCHDLFKRRSAGRTITLTIVGDSGGYAVNHEDKAEGDNTITYADGEVTYSTV